MSASATSTPRLRRVVIATERVTTAIAILSTTVLLLATAMDVVLRILTGHGVPGTVEVTEVLLVVAVFMGMATAATDDLHIRATILTDRLPFRIRRIVRFVGDVIGMGMVVWLIYATALRAISSVTSGEYRFGLVSMPIWPARIAIVLGLAGLLLAMLLKTIDRLHEVGGEGE